MPNANNQHVYLPILKGVNNAVVPDPNSVVVPFIAEQVSFQNSFLSEFGVQEESGLP